MNAKLLKVHKIFSNKISVFMCKSLVYFGAPSLAASDPLTLFAGTTALHRGKVVAEQKL